MALGSRFSRTPAEEQQRRQGFFAEMQHPLVCTPVKTPPANPAGPALAAAALGMGALIVIAGLLSESVTARNVDTAVGITLIGVGLLLRRRTKKHKLTVAFPPGSQDRISRAGER
jgi:hypothetical protein